jgi:hypothetical protein
MNILFTKIGTTKSGSWQMRGVQIAQPLDARAKANPTESDLDWADVVILVKSFDDLLVHRIKSRRKPIIWDAIDCWPQPEGNSWDVAKAIAYLKSRVMASGASLVITSTSRMAYDLGDAVRTKTIYHHYRFNQEVNPIRERIEAIGYEGSARYLEGGWFSAIGKACERRKCTFMINPPRLSAVDIVFAVRGGPWRGYATDHWKSNVKLANAQVTGTPFIGLQESGCRDTASGAEVWVENPEEVEDAVWSLEHRSIRKEKAECLIKHAVNFETILDDYRKAVNFVLSR